MKLRFEDSESDLLSRAQVPKARSADKKARTLADALAAELQARACTNTCSPHQPLHRRWGRWLATGTSVAAMIDVDYTSTLK